MDFAYSSRVIINEENAESLLEAADMLQFHDIRDAAAEFLEKNLHSSNCLGMMLLSDAHQCKRLYELSWRMCLLHYETVKMVCTLLYGGGQGSGGRSTPTDVMSHIQYIMLKYFTVTTEPTLNSPSVITEQ